LLDWEVQILHHCRVQGIMARTMAATKKKIIKAKAVTRVPVPAAVKSGTLARPAAAKSFLEAKQLVPKAPTTQAVAKPAAETPQKMDIDQFFAFCACSLKMEAQVLMNHNVELQENLSRKIWPEVERMCSRNLGKNEKWVPMHTVLGVHEFYVCERIHHAKVPAWNSKRRFITMFIFRSHCKRELFDQVQLPFIEQESFWKDPIAAFNRKTPMEKAIKAFRAKGHALQTSCFLIIPERLVDDDDENLIINLLARTQRLIQLAEDLWPMVNDTKTSTAEKFETIRSKIRSVRSLGDTWVKMLTVVIDIALPNLQLLQDRCEVGIGASDPLRKILEGEGLLIPKEPRPPRDSTEYIKRTEAFVIVPQIKVGIMAVKKKNKQLLQVTHGAAGSVDRAYVIAEKLCEAANAGKDISVLNTLKRKWLEDKSIVARDLGYDKKMAAAIAAPQPAQVDRSNEPSPMDALKQLRDKLMATNSQSSREFHRVLRLVEEQGKKHFKHLPLVAQQMKSSKLGMSCATLQVQLCEFRQFQNFLHQNGIE